MNFQLNEKSFTTPSQFQNIKRIEVRLSPRESGNLYSFAGDSSPRNNNQLSSPRQLKENIINSSPMSKSIESESEASYWKAQTQALEQYLSQLKLEKQRERKETESFYESKLESLTSVFNSQITSSNTRLSELESENEKLKSQISLLISSHSTEITKSNLEISKGKSEISELKAKISNLKEKNEEFTLKEQMEVRDEGGIDRKSIRSLTSRVRSVSSLKSSPPSFTNHPRSIKSTKTQSSLKNLSFLRKTNNTTFFDSSLNSSCLATIEESRPNDSFSNLKRNLSQTNNKGKFISGDSNVLCEICEREFTLREFIDHSKICH